MFAGRSQASRMPRRVFLTTVRCRNFAVRGEPVWPMLDPVFVRGPASADG